MKASFEMDVGRNKGVSEVMPSQLDQLQQQMASLSDRMTTRQMNLEFALDDLRETLIDECDRIRQAIQPAAAEVPPQRDPVAPDLTEAVRALEVAVSERDRIIAALRASSSWRITRPLRLMHRVVRSPRRTARDIAVFAVRWALTKPALRQPGLMVAARLPTIVKARLKRAVTGAPSFSSATLGTFTLQIEPPASITIDELSPSARVVYNQLKRAIAKDDQ